VETHHQAVTLGMFPETSHRKEQQVGNHCADEAVHIPHIIVSQSVDACRTLMANGVGNLCVSIDLDQLWAITLPRAGHFFFCIDSRRPTSALGQTRQNSK
jgi:hypothetical protein